MEVYYTSYEHVNKFCRNS